MKPVIAITTGDPFGIGPEICLKAAAREDVLDACRPLRVGDRAHLLREAQVVDASGAATAAAGGSLATIAAAWPDVSVSAFAEMGSKQGADNAIEAWGAGPAFYDIADLDERIGPRVPTAVGGRAAVKYIKQAVGLVRSGSAAAIVTAPISKSALRLAGYSFPGHTELLADLCGAEPGDVTMLFVAGDLKVALLSVHEAVREAIAGLSRERIVRRLAIVHAEHERWFGAPPRLALAALNPHAGEEGLFGTEERDILEPAVAEARALGVDVTGPLPADTVFVRATRGEFDAVLALFHDQGTIAVKTHAFGHAVNMTLGLPFARTSVDHGTAWDIAGKGIADAGSLAAAILLAARLAPRAGR
jgi:4-hydroxythreonine-4-phosphate dehydrogenase